MEDALCRFHALKDISFLSRAGIMVNGKANVPWMEHVKKWTVEEERHAESCAPCKKQREMNAWREYMSHEIHVSKVLDADFNFLTIH